MYSHEHAKLWLSIFVSASTGEKIVSPLEFEEKKKIEAEVEAEHRSQFPLQIELLPHQHTLFCERKQRVCLAVGRTQELEKVRVLSVPSSSSSSIMWTRSLPGEENGQYFPIAGSEGCMEYTFGAEDVGCYINVECDEDDSQIEVGKTDYIVSKLIAAPIGPVLSGPARLLDVHIVAEGCRLQKNDDGTEISCFLPGTTIFFYCSRIFSLSPMSYLLNR